MSEEEGTDRAIRPSHRKRHASTKPSESVRSEYQVGEYIVPPSDPRGRHANLSASCPPEFRRLMSILLQEKSFPFETESDIIRWCMHFGLRTLDKRKKNPNLKAEIARLDSWLSIMVEESEMMYYGGRLAAIERAVIGLARGGHTVRARQVAEKIWRESSNLSDKYWRALYVRRGSELVKRVEKIAKVQAAREEQ